MKIGGRSLVYVCSPLRASTPEGQAQNEATAARMCQILWEMGFLPVAPHLYFPRFAPDSDPRSRAGGIKAGLELIAYCERMVVLDAPPSEGMRGEIEEAIRLGIPIHPFATRASLEPLRAATV